MEHEYIVHHISRKDFRLEHLLASMQPEKYSEDYSNHSNDSKDGQPAPEKLEALVAQSNGVQNLSKRSTNVFRRTRHL